ncbi:Transcriptional regulator, MerR family OS=Tsukamurella paurometabola (strain ATCC 8368 / DSM/ CCUG 35730 / CIP 100753 / JCM 10117 / KCTC 9821 / NBRC 16120/ NCIMB 702349 / NCTC 13040) OX=521096 GN=Tpau_1354 PE=4 SV=1 [Tsukamurella paurometabola]|uniref:Transcriptional regulator, MerR family n=1 Tax=Tsukamurella paurometabola (strain ATCC 8368 / DSM 20162 / CCUG 35730 / CIP 100753 / JCM 10117 / KCTC 9821 / NBRC 16120 / NCIMB 702349 / NCTC 13040) TaxID=521096 RepID=D5UWW1_TSUPD|nr:MerR family transcriptional regulator [Tsukamurella paurometabola]ADG77983.1 transcriptional regulator, MerR family [Tsukamurella paurometabola DSM 20162]SUP29636.1 Mercuric resistance operon regulatory protein [Tsukamurella paurometabola]
MPWSTRELADLAGTTVRAVRHYHHVGLLDEPVRQSNGYKQYGVGHLLRLVRIKRLSELGFSLQQIAGMGDAQTLSAGAVQALDAELAESIDRMQQVRDELASLQSAEMPTDLPAEVAEYVTDMSDADRSLIVVMTRVLGPSGITAYADMLRYSSRLGPDADPTGPEFDALPADADEATRLSLAERMLPYSIALIDNNPAVATATLESPGGAGHFARTIAEAMRDVYNPAQLDVLARLGVLMDAHRAATAPSDQG